MGQSCFNSFDFSQFPSTGPLVHAYTIEVPDWFSLFFSQILKKWTRQDTPERETILATNKPAKIESQAQPTAILLCPSSLHLSSSTSPQAALASFSLWFWIGPHNKGNANSLIHLLWIHTTRELRFKWPHRKQESTFSFLFACKWCCSKEFPYKQYVIQSSSSWS